MSSSEPSSPSRSIQSTTSDECFICMEKTEDPVLNIIDYDVARSCHCDAKLHPKCYVGWLRTSTSCPICRTPISNDNYRRLAPPVMINPLAAHGNFAIDRLPNYVIVQQGVHNRRRLFCEYFFTICGIIIVIGLVFVYSTSI